MCEGRGIRLEETSPNSHLGGGQSQEELVLLRRGWLEADDRLCGKRLCLSIDQWQAGKEEKRGKA